MHRKLKLSSQQEIDEKKKQFYVKIKLWKL